MKSLAELSALALVDMGARCGVATAADVGTLRRRVEHEGESFLTITLPAFASDFESCLEARRVVPGAFASFGKLRSGLPTFMRGFLHRVFDKKGCLRPNPSIDCIKAVRQVALLAKKVLLPCAQAREEAAVDGFRSCDADLPLMDELPNEELTAYYRRTARVVAQCLRLPEDLWETGLKGRHGPGQTVERLKGNAKWAALGRWPTRLEEAGLSRAHATWGVRGPYGLFEESWVYDPATLGSQSVAPEDEHPVRVTLVPKTLKAPRVIAVEPVSMQFAQQALRDVLYDAIEESALTKGHVNFRDQGVNQDLAMLSSRTRQYATLDMKDASDRVSMEHVESLLSGMPGHWPQLIRAARSERAELPSGERITLRKFASMGSALCFPIESLVFFSSIIAIRLWSSGAPISASTVKTSSRDVYVYGDDLIVPTDEAPTICDGLEALGFKVNRRKSFWNGDFRESCGVDAFQGAWVTPVYLRRPCPAGRGDVSGLLSAIATANQLWMAGMQSTARALRRSVEVILGRLPLITTVAAGALREWVHRVTVEKTATESTSPALGFVWDSTYDGPQRWNRHLQRRETRVWVVVPLCEPDPLEGFDALAKCVRGGSKPVHPILHGIEEPTYALGHLEASPRSYALTLKRRWVPSTELG